MPTSRDVGARDFDDTVATPGSVIRSRIIPPQPDPPYTDALEGVADQVTCPVCGCWFPGVATRCPDDGTLLATVTATE